MSDVGGVDVDVGADADSDADDRDGDYGGDDVGMDDCVVWQLVMMAQRLMNQRLKAILLHHHLPDVHVVPAIVAVMHS